MKRVFDGRRLIATAFAFSFSILLSLSPAFALSTAQEDQLSSIANALEKEEDVTPAMLSNLESILEMEPENYRAHLLLGEYYEHLSLKDQASAQYKLAAANSPSDPQAMINLIKLQVRAGQLQAASALVKKAKERFPNDAQVNFWEGNFSFETDQNKAESAYLRAIKENEQITGLPTALAEVRLKQGRYMEAYLLASVDISHDRKFWTAYKIKGFAAFGMGDFKQAVILLGIAFDHLNGRSKSAKGLAVAALRAGRYDVGLEPALVYLGRTSSLTDLSIEQKQLIAALWRHIPIDEARAILAKTEAQYGLSKNAAYHFAMGDVFDRLGLVPDAVQEYQRGLAIKADFGRGQFRLARDLELYYHRYNDALDGYKLAHQLAPDDQEIAENLYRLEARLQQKDSDLAWRLKDLLRSPPN